MIQRFKTTIPVQGKEVTFRFEPVNILKLQLFQVYVQHGDRECRFHMQVDKDHQFKFAMVDVVPPPFLELEEDLHLAILQNCSET